MRFLHAADIHLDSPMAGLPPRDGGWGNPTRRAFVNMIDLAIREDVAFVVIAGDLYDGDWKDHSTGLFFAEQMARLGRPCILVRGNHDAHSQITKRLRPPPNVLEFRSDRAHSIPLPELGVALHGRSYHRRDVLDDISLGYPDRAAGMLNIGVLHTSAEDPGRHGNYAPCRLPALAARGYDYWALGHVHDRRELHDSPWIVFSGNTQGRHVNETGEKSIALIDVQDQRVVAVQHRATDVLRWAATEVDLGAASHEEVWARISAALSAELAAAEGRPVVTRLHLTGTTDQHQTLAADPAQLLQDARAEAVYAGDIAIESVRLRTRAPADSAEHADLRAAFEASLSGDVSAALLRDIGKLAAAMPRSVHAAGPDLPHDADSVRALVPDAWELVLRELARG